MADSFLVPMPFHGIAPFDVLVVGTGPAGNTVALTCARAGLRVLLIEREALPRRKVCGGGLSPRALQALPLAIDPVVEQRIEGLWLGTSPQGPLLKRLPKPGAMVRRETFDHFMALAAREAGATLEDRCAFLDFEREPGGLVRVITSQGEVRTRILVGADGVHSAVRKKALPTCKVKTVAAIEALVEPRPEHRGMLEGRALVDFQGIDGGYAWLFPKEGHINAGLYRFRKTPANRDLKAVLHRFLETHPMLRGGKILDLRGYEIPVQAVPALETMDPVLLVGDAAGLAEAFFGEGIYYALRSGAAAGEAIVDALQRGGSLEAYRTWLRATGRSLLASQLTAGLFYRLPVSAIDRMVRSRFLNELFFGVLSGQVSPWRCLLASAAAAPGWLLGHRPPAGPSDPGH